MQNLIPGGNSSNLDRRQMRVKKIKVIILTVVTTLLILPSICCILLFLKLNSLELQIKQLKTGVNASVQTNKTNEIKSDEIKKNELDDLEPPDTPEPSLTPGPSDAPLDSLKEDTKDSLGVFVERNDKTSIEETIQQKSTKIIKKKVYLTFDDGPSIYSNAILDILSEYNIKATFFVLGKTDEESKKIYKRIVNEGHTLGMHSYSHNYKSIYSSVEAFSKDIIKLRNLLHEVTGFTPVIYRFPGGSSNTVSKIRISECITYLNKNSITYYDWNVVNGDALGSDLSKKELISNVINGVDKHSESIVLMHDAASKQNTLNSLSDLIEALLKKEVEFFPLDQTVKPIQHRTIK